MSDWEVIVAILGLTVITVVTRSFFFLSRRELVLPTWVRRGMRYAPLAALAAVVAPEVFMTDGHLITSWQDPRLWAAAISAAYFFLRRELLGTIVAGTIVFLVGRWFLG